MAKLVDKDKDLAKSRKLRQDFRMLNKTKYDKEINLDGYIKFLTYFNKIFKVKRKAPSEALRGKIFKI